MITIIQVLLIVALALLVRKSRKDNKIKDYIFVLIGGVVIFLFGPLMGQAELEGAIDVGVQIACTVFGIYCFIWSIVRMIKGNKKSLNTSEVK